MGSALTEVHWRRRRSPLSVSGSSFPTRLQTPGSPRPQAGDPAPWAPRAGSASESFLSRNGFLLLGSQTFERLRVRKWHHEAFSPMPGWSRREDGGAVGSPAPQPQRTGGSRGGGASRTQLSPRGSKCCRGNPGAGLRPAHRRLSACFSAPGSPRQSQCPAVLGKLHHQICGDSKRPQSKARRERQAPLRNWQVDRAGKPGGCSGQGAPKSQISAVFRVGTGRPAGSRSRV